MKSRTSPLRLFCIGLAGLAGSSLLLAQVPSPVEALGQYLEKPEARLEQVGGQSFAKQALTREQADAALTLLAGKRAEQLRKDRADEFKKRSITVDGKTLKYAYRTLGEKPEGGHSLYISMHGGGGAPPRVNDGQWANQIKLYTPKEGIYLAPRAPGDTWDLWHLAHVDVLFDRLIENFVAFEGVNPNKVYVLGYSAGGDGTYQLAPRMADRWAGAAMMAGHPGDAQTYNLRNLPYFIQCGGKDAAYKRNRWCEAWGEKLDALEKKDPGAYPHKWIVYPNHGHWMNLECRKAIPWMAKHTRNPWPNKVLWCQDNVTHKRFYWLANKDPRAKQMITAEVKGQEIVLRAAKEDQKMDPPVLDKAHTGTFAPLGGVQLRLSDALLDLDKPVTVKDGAGTVLFQGKVERRLDALATSLDERLDPSSAASATLDIKW